MNACSILDAVQIYRGGSWRELEEGGCGGGKRGVRGGWWWDPKDDDQSQMCKTKQTKYHIRINTIRYDGSSTFAIPVC